MELRDAVIRAHALSVETQSGAGVYKSDDFRSFEVKPVPYGRNQYPCDRNLWYDADYLFYNGEARKSRITGLNAPLDEILFAIDDGHRRLEAFLLSDESNSLEGGE